MIIAIDGTSGSGKSTIAKKLASTLGFGFFSAGDLYRAITHKALRIGIDENDETRLRNMIETTKIIYTYNGVHNIMEVDGIDITVTLHDEQISENVTKYASKEFVREYVRKLQKDMPNHTKDIVMEGRDIGSVIFPDADFKVYVDCDAETRAQRRFSDLSANDPTLSYEKVLEDLKERDFKDITRAISPLIMCENAYLLDTSSTNIRDCIKKLINQMITRGLLPADYLENHEIKV